MITNRRNRFGSAGSLRNASARLVSGPVASPISSPGCAWAARTQAVAASSRVELPIARRQFGVSQAP